MNHYKSKLHRTLTYLIALIWLVNGLFCKVLELIPRHEEIISEILGAPFAPLFTMTIGLAEICIALWIVSGKFSRFNAVLQISVIGLMNILEFAMVPDLLLWGRYNFIYALMLIFVIWYNEFILGKNSIQKA